MTSEVMALREALVAIRQQLAKHDGCSRFGVTDLAALEDAKRAIDGAGRVRVRNVRTCLLGSAVDVRLPAGGGEWRQGWSTGSPTRGCTVVAVYTVDAEAGQEFRFMVRTPSGGLAAGVELGQVVACPDGGNFRAAFGDAAGGGQSSGGPCAENGFKTEPGAAATARRQA